jgi:hypothetical protein
MFGEVFTMRVVACPCRADSGAFTKLTPAARTGGWVGCTGPGVAGRGVDVGTGVAAHVGVGSDPPPTPREDEGGVAADVPTPVSLQAAAETNNRAPTNQAPTVFRRSLPKPSYPLC